MDLAQGALSRPERVHDGRVELAPRLLDDLAPGLVPSHGAAVGPVARHRVERVGYGEDPRRDRDVGAGAAVGVSVTVSR